MLQFYDFYFWATLGVKEVLQLSKIFILIFYGFRFYITPTFLKSVLEKICVCVCVCVCLSVCLCVCTILATPNNFQTTYPIDTKFWLHIVSYRNSPAQLIPFLNFEKCSRQKFLNSFFLHLINMGKFSNSYYASDIRLR